MEPEEAEALGTITPRQLQVLRLLSRGMTNAQIAREMGISANTVRIHVERVRKQLGARTRGEAVAKAYQMGLLG